MAQSRYGVVVLSSTYVTKLWPLEEFFTLVNRETGGRKVILPVFHEITPEQLSGTSLDMASRWATHTGKGMAQVVEDLIRAINADKKKRRKRLLLSIALALTIVGSLFVGWNYSGLRPAPLTDLTIEQVVFAYIEEQEQELLLQHERDVQHFNGIESASSVLEGLYDEYSRTPSYYRNTYHYEDRQQTVQFRKNVNSVLGEDIDGFTPVNHFKMDSFASYLIYDSVFSGSREIRFCYLNRSPVGYVVEGRLSGDEQEVADIKFLPFIRHFDVTLRFPEHVKDTKRRHIVIHGLPAQERFVFHRRESGWEGIPTGSGG